jgi:hypothetical protein
LSVFDRSGRSLEKQTGKPSLAKDIAKTLLISFNRRAGESPELANGLRQKPFMARIKAKHGKLDAVTDNQKVANIKT